MLFSRGELIEIEDWDEFRFDRIETRLVSDGEDQ
jgi:hypothetical protein